VPKIPFDIVQVFFFDPQARSEIMADIQSCFLFSRGQTTSASFSQPPIEESSPTGQTSARAKGSFHSAISLENEKATFHVKGHLFLVKTFLKRGDFHGMTTNGTPTQNPKNRSSGNSFIAKIIDSWTNKD